VGPYPRPVVTPFRGACVPAGGAESPKPHTARCGRAAHAAISGCRAGVVRPQDVRLHIGPNPNARVRRGATNTWWPASSSGHLRTRSQHSSGRLPRARVPAFQSAQGAGQSADCPCAPAHRDAGALTCP